MPRTRLHDGLSEAERRDIIADLETRAQQLSDETTLSTRQALVRMLKSAGLSYSDIADELGLSSKGTVADHHEAAVKHITSGTTLARLTGLNAVTGDPLLYRQDTKEVFRPLHHGESRINGVRFFVYEHQRTGHLVWREETLMASGDEATKETRLKLYDREDAEGHDAGDSALIGDMLADADREHLGESVAAALAIDAALGYDGRCLSLVQKHHKADYDEADILAVVEQPEALVTPEEAADMLLQPHHDASVLEDVESS